VQTAGSAIARHLRPGAAVILESTTYPGTTRELLLPLLERHSGLRSPGDFYIGYSPGCIDPGNPRWRLENTPKAADAVVILAGHNTFDYAMIEQNRSYVFDTRARCHGANEEMKVVALRGRPAGGGVEPPQAALAEDRRGERWGKGAR
jgi:UDP-N-acetyl-D-mannosaminuronate dehydrogenase